MPYEPPLSFASTPSQSWVLSHSQFPFHLLFSLSSSPSYRLSPLTPIPLLPPSPFPPRFPPSFSMTPFPLLYPFLLSAPPPSLTTPSLTPHLPSPSPTPPPPPPPPPKRLTTSSLRPYDAPPQQALKSWSATPQNFEKIALGLATNRKVDKDLMTEGERRKVEEFERGVGDGRGR